MVNKEFFEELERLILLAYILDDSSDDIDFEEWYKKE